MREMSDRDRFIDIWTLWFIAGIPWVKAHEK